ncbi:BTB/POZ domain-containing protein At3g19850-like isoform X2 [Momordica charantia]|uniref:BTB/POZ domain-containing protein At3g19850-like isoform X2 n=1 Tax=Momordica charantia TaxID=3673 RepID=A0A6J1CWY8_MOMCH|nr:BTB/POZ domain-containing protein At3g19850-like isoform X2 [Momordica charantia]
MAPHLQVHIAAHQTFFLSEKVISTYSARFRRIIKQRRRTRRRTNATSSSGTDCSNSAIEIDDFPGGANGFELVSRFCYNHAQIDITVSNVALLHCCAVFLGMTEDVAAGNLIRQTENFLDGIFYWPWSDLILCIQSCESFFSFADSSGLLQKLVCAVLAKIAQNSNMSLVTPSSSSSSSPDNASGNSRFSTAAKSWWFDDMSLLSAQIIEKVVQGMGSYGSNNKSLILTRFLLHYLKTAAQSSVGYGSGRPRSEYGGLADTAVHGVVNVMVGKSMFSCRGLFWVLRVVSGFGLSRDCRSGLEKMIGGMLDQAKLDDLLISGHHRCTYDVNLVIRLVRVFVNSDGVYSVHKLKKVGKLVDKYLGEISPDQNLKISKFLGVAESLPDCARDCFDGVYRAIDIYLESHLNLSMEERSTLCRCLNHEKLSLETCRALAKNPRVPPRIAVEALKCQARGGGCSSEEEDDRSSGYYSECQRVLSSSSIESEGCSSGTGREDMKLNLQKMQWRVVELEKVCREMRSNMSSLVRQSVITSPPVYHRALPRLC